MSESRFYWIRVEHWSGSGEERNFPYSRYGKDLLQDYMWDKVNNGWVVTQIKLMNRRD